MTVQDMYKRDEAMWHMFTRCGWHMQDIAEIFKVTKARVHQILTLCSKRKGEELKVYETKA